MVKHITALFYILCALFCCTAVWGQDDPEFIASVNKSSLSINERVQLTFELSANGNKFRAPDLNADFSIYSGPNQSTSMSYINGRMSTSMSFSYVLQPKRKGKLIIEPATIEVNGKRIRSNPIEITVTDRSENRQPDQRQSAQQKKPSEDNVFMAVEVNKGQVFAGEQLRAVYKLYSRHPVRGVDRQKLPDLTGFYSNEIDEQNRPVREVINGKPYDVYTLKKYILFPQRHGELSLDPMEFDMTVQVRSDEPVQTFFGPRYQMIDKNIKIKSKPKTIRVNPLPRPKPKHFTGAVGKYEYNVTVDRETAETNESITLTYKVSGSGNINLIELPEHNLPPDFEVYDPKVNIAKTKGADVLSGTKTWEYLLIPRNPGVHEIETPAFSYFNPAEKRYKTIESKTYTITVTGDPTETARTGGSGRTKHQVEQLDTDIRFIKTGDPDFIEKQHNPFTSGMFWTLLLLPCILAAVFVYFTRRNAELRADVAAYRKHKATKTAARKLKTAKKHLDKGESEAFYEEIYRAVYDYLADKLGIEQSRLNRDLIVATLKDKNVKTETVEELVAIIETCEMARFSPSGSKVERELYERTSKCIQNIESVLK